MARLALDEKKMLMDREEMIFIFVSVIVGSVTLYSTVVHTGDRLAKAMVLCNTNVSDKELFLRNVKDMSKAISTGAAQGLNHTNVGYPQWWF
jgi:hypothetical protein